jgi:hypothetical protein
MNAFLIHQFSQRHEPCCTVFYPYQQHAATPLGRFPKYFTSRLTLPRRGGGQLIYVPLDIDELTSDVSRHKWSGRGRGEVIDKDDRKQEDRMTSRKG